VVKAPATAIILLTEITGSLGYFLPASIVVVTSFLVTEGLGVKPIYDSLLQRMLVRNGNPPIANAGGKHLIEVPVRLGSAFDGRHVKDIGWPVRCLLVGITRDSGEIIPSGETMMMPGDSLAILIQEKDFPQAAAKLLKMAEELSGPVGRHT
jgi:NhaP-type Na+/H+ and K+/H+ antiporter